MKGKMIGLLVVMIVTSTQAFAWTECLLTPQRVWQRLDAPYVWVCFEGAKCIYKTQGGTVTEAHLNRMYSAAMAAITADKQLLVRYPEDNGDCSVLSNTNRNDILGFWYVK